VVVVLAVVVGTPRIVGLVVVVVVVEAQKGLSPSLYYYY
jgi:hypothetical protein